MDETTQNPGKTEVSALTPEPEDSLEHVLDAWAAEPSARKRYDRLRLERRDGEALEVLLDAETARDLGDKLTIVAARSRQRSRGEAPVATDQRLDAGAAEDLARARKVLDLLGLGSEVHADVDVLVEEFRASREDVAKAHAMIDEQREKHARDLAASDSPELEGLRKQNREILAAEATWIENAVERNNRIAALEAELESVKADRNKLIAEAAQRDVDAHAAIDLSDPSDPVQS